MRDRLTFGPDRGTIPYRGPFPLVQDSDPAQVQPQVVADAGVKILDLSDDEQLKEYVRICNLVANGRGQFGHCDFQYDNDSKSWRVLIHWVEWYKESAEAAAQKKLSL